MPDGQRISLLAEMRMQPVAQAARQICQLYRFQRLPHLRLGDIAPQRHISQKGIRHHYRVLLNHRHALA
ncbi:Uncharacterised protein [Salmonella enterica subsp. enterica serovar Bovismorbificans]|uniref:Uncharacterized protein n=2 Tax=Salmonella enterica subsp. enterica serovar Bovismorbificans TaxID=58097 RepID=A0A655EAZ6_SALET|nr:Uncharacterised protein [Salmonella enterica subsp. enterica serovar Bovismorbificans]